MSRKKKKRRFEDAPAESAAPPGVSRAEEAEPAHVEGAPSPRWSRAASDSSATQPATQPRPWVSSERAPQDARAAAAVAPESPPEEEPSEKPSGFFAWVSNWWRSLSGSGESVELHAKLAPPPAVREAGATVSAPLPASPDFAGPAAEAVGPVDADPVAALDSSLRLAAGLEKLQEKLHNREKHLESLREQRNGLHQQMKVEREAAEGRIRTLEEELTDLRSHAEEPAAQLQAALAASTARIEALEAELVQTRDNAATAQAALAAQESRLRGLEEEIARMNAPIEEALEQYRLEKEATRHRLRSLEADLDATRDQVKAAEARAHALQSETSAALERAEAAEGRAATLEAELGQAGAELEQRQAELERSRTELEAAHTLASEMSARAEKAAEPPPELFAELDAARRQAQELGQKVEELTRRLALAEQEQESGRGEGERELEQAQQEARRALGQVRDLEAALQQAEQAAHERESELVGVKRQLETLEAEAEEPRPARRPVPPPAGRERAEPAPAAAEASAQVAAELYKQALTPLTVLNASADLLVMSLQDPSLKESAQDIKFQTQTLMELLKKAAQPPEKK